MVRDTAEPLLTFPFSEFGEKYTSAGRSSDCLQINWSLELLFLIIILVLSVILNYPDIPKLFCQPNTFDLNINKYPLRTEPL